MIKFSRLERAVLLLEYLQIVIAAVLGFDFWGITFVWILGAGEFVMAAALTELRKQTRGGSKT